MTDRSHPRRRPLAHRAAALTLVLAAGLGAAAADVVGVGDLITAVWGGAALMLADGLLHTADPPEPPLPLPDDEP